MRKHFSGDLPTTLEHSLLDTLLLDVGAPIVRQSVEIDVSPPQPIKHAELDADDLDTLRMVDEMVEAKASGVRSHPQPRETESLNNVHHTDGTRASTRSDLEFPATPLFAPRPSILYPPRPTTYEPSKPYVDRGKRH